MTNNISNDRVEQLVNTAKSMSYAELGILLAAFVTEAQRETVIDMCNDDVAIAADMFDNADVRGFVDKNIRVMSGNQLFDIGKELMVDLDIDHEMDTQFKKHNIGQYFCVKLSRGTVTAS